MPGERGSGKSPIIESIKAWNDVPVTRLSPEEHAQALQTAVTTRRKVEEMLSGEISREYIDREGQTLHLATRPIVPRDVDLQVTRWVNLGLGGRILSLSMQAYSFHPEGVIKTTHDKDREPGTGRFVSQRPEKHEANHEELMDLTRLLQTSRPANTP